MYINNMLMVATSVVFSVLAMAVLMFIKSKMGVEVVNLRVKVLFYTDAAYHGEHGKISVSNKTLHLQDEVVRFVFIGLTAPPKLDVSVLAHIWQEALAQGFIPHHIVEYGTVNDLQVKTPNQPGGNAGNGYTSETTLGNTFTGKLVPGTGIAGASWNVQEYPTENGKLEVATKGNTPVEDDVASAARKHEAKRVEVLEKDHVETLAKFRAILKGQQEETAPVKDDQERVLRQPGETTEEFVARVRDLVLAGNEVSDPLKEEVKQEPKTFVMINNSPQYPATLDDAKAGGNHVDKTMPAPEVTTLRNPTVTDT